MMERRLWIFVAAAVALGLATSILAATAQWTVAGVLAGLLLTVISVFVIVGSTNRNQHAEQRDITALAERVAQLEDSTPQRQVVKQVSGAIKSQTREVEALLQLYGWVEASEPMPPSGPWAMNPQGLLTLVGLVRRNRPRVVVELGSGISTVWIAYALAANGPVGVNDSSRPGRLISLDHDATYASQSQELLSRHAESVAPSEVRHAPLEAYEIGAEGYMWYSRDVIRDLPEIDMLIVDGPPGGTGPLARYPAVGLLADQLADGAVVVLDDSTRDDERAIADRWMAENEGMSREYSPINRLAVFRYSTKK